MVWFVKADDDVASLPIESAELGSEMAAALAGEASSSRPGVPSAASDHWHLPFIIIRSTKLNF